MAAKPHIRLQGGVWRVMGPQGSVRNEQAAKSFVRRLNKAAGSRRATPIKADARWCNKGNAAWQELGR